MDESLRSKIRIVLHRARHLDWDAPHFSAKKAHVCASLSRLVYRDVQEYELKQASRIHLFFSETYRASETYRGMIKSGTTNDLLNELAEANFEARFFIIRGRFAVIFGTVLRNLVILAIRGAIRTRLWDWKANLDTRKYHVTLRDALPLFEPANSANFEDQFFHRGFFEAVVPHMRSIKSEISHRANSDNVKVVWTGHSLGGAMAAIGNAVSREHATRRLLWNSFSPQVAGAYTFGMPRYGGLGTICCFESPHHVYFQDDLVPTLPLRKMGYADASKEYELTSEGTITLSERSDPFGLVGHIPKIFSSLKAHKIKGYVDALSVAAQAQPSRMATAKS